MNSSSSRIMRAAIRGALTNPSPHSWGSEFTAALLACDVPHVQHFVTRFAPLEPSLATTSFAVKHFQTWRAVTSCPSVPDCQHRRLSAYAYFFDTDSPLPTQPWYIAHVCSARKQQLLAQARCSCSPLLPVDTGRITHVPFHQRTCPVCQAAVCDLQHVCFDCPTNPLPSIRTQFAMSASTLQDLKHPSFPPDAAAKLIIACLYAWAHTACLRHGTPHIQ